MGKQGRMKPALLTSLLLVAVSVAVGQPGPRAPERLAWEQAGALAAPRAYATAVTLVTGEILVVGGLDKDDPKVTSVTSELFDPLTGHARVLDQRLPGRVQHAAVAGAGGRVAIIGGSVWIGDGWAITDRVDVYLPYEHRWKEGQPMLHGRTGVRATALKDGRIFVTGGYDGPRLIKTSEIYDPMSDHWSEASAMIEPRGDFSIATLDDGRVLVAGGLFGRESIQAVSSLYYDVARDRWSPGPELLSPRVLHTQAKLPNGDVLLIGGEHAASDTTVRYRARGGGLEYHGPLSGSAVVADALVHPGRCAIVNRGLLLAAV